MISNKKFYNIGESLTEGQILFRRRMSFNVHQNKKLQKKIVQALKVISRVGTSMFKLMDIELNSQLLMTN